MMIKIGMRGVDRENQRIGKVEAHGGVRWVVIGCGYGNLEEMSRGR